MRAYWCKQELDIQGTTVSSDGHRDTHTYATRHLGTHKAPSKQKTCWSEMVSQSEDQC